MKIQIIADGDPFHTRIFDEQGNEINNIQRVRWEQDNHHSPLLHLTLAFDYTLDLKGQPIYEMDQPTKTLIHIITKRIIARILRRWWK
jgi:hypothetical protein